MNGVVSAVTGASIFTALWIQSSTAGSEGPWGVHDWPWGVQIHSPTKGLSSLQDDGEKRAKEGRYVQTLSRPDQEEQDLQEREQQQTHTGQTPHAEHLPSLHNRTGIYVSDYNKKNTWQYFPSVFNNYVCFSQHILRFIIFQNLWLRSDFFFFSKWGPPNLSHGSLNFKIANHP